MKALFAALGSVAGALMPLINVLRNVGAVVLLGTLIAAAILVGQVQRNPAMQRRVADIERALSGQKLWREDEVTAHFEQRTRELGGDSQALLATRRRLEQEWDTNLLRQEAYASQREQLLQDFAEARGAVQKVRDDLAAERKAFETQVQEDLALRQSAGFRKNLEMLAKVDPASGADLVWYWPPEMAVRYLEELGTRQSAELVSALVEKARETQEGRDREDRARASKLMEVLEKNGFIPKTAGKESGR